MFVHNDPEFPALVRIVAEEQRLAPSLVEKDYWVTHTLWALHQTGLAIEFKGGTSLSKAFQLIQRFSEDVDVKIESGTVSQLPAYGSVRSETAGAIAKRQAYFEALQPHLAIPDTTVVLHDLHDPRYRSAVFVVTYAGHFLDQLSPVFRPHVLLEAGLGITPPAIPVPISSWIHDFLERQGREASYTRNRPAAVNCVHPAVTLLEKLDAITRRYGRDPFDAPSIIRHYEDAAHIIQHLDCLPPIPGGGSISTLAVSLLEHRLIRRPVRADDQALTLTDTARYAALEEAHEAIEPMFWGERVPLRDACATIQRCLDTARP